MEVKAILLNSIFEKLQGKRTKTFRKLYICIQINLSFIHDNSFLPLFNFTVLRLSYVFPYLSELIVLYPFSGLVSRLHFLILKFLSKFILHLSTSINIKI